LDDEKPQLERLAVYVEKQRVAVDDDRPVEFPKGNMFVAIVVGDIGGVLIIVSDKVQCIVRDDSVSIGEQGMEFFECDSIFHDFDFLFDGVVQSVMLRRHFTGGRRCLSIYFLRKLFH
jgi:hypothetical protein